MELFFLACFLFGALFTMVSVGLGFAGAALHGSHAGDAGSLAHGGHDVAAGELGHAADAPDLGHAADAPDLAPAQHHLGGNQPGGIGGRLTPIFHLGRPALLLLNLSSMLAFLTWFGAAGYLLLHFALWPLLGAILVAVVAGGAGASVMALFLAKVRASERVMEARDYELPGTVARVTVRIPPSGVGEIVFVKGGGRRSEAARGFDGRAISRGAEVVIVDYQRGVATVDVWNELETSM